MNGEDEDSVSFMMGSLHTLSIPDEVPYEKRKGPKARMGFHPPERAWDYAEEE